MAIIGAGRAGTAFGALLQGAGHRVVGASGGPRSARRATRFLPEARFFPPSGAARAAALAEVVILSVPDDAVQDVCRDMAAASAFRPGQRVLHLAGAIGLDALSPAEERGAVTLSLHPLQSFPSVEEGIARLPGSAMAVTARSPEGERFGEALAEAVGGRPFPLPEVVKPLYHAAAVFCSNYLVVVEGLAERLFRLAGLAEPVPLFAPLARTALESALVLGPAEALTGPAARGDAGTIRRNLEAIAKQAPEAILSYVALARVAVDLAAGAGRLPGERRARLEEELDRWAAWR